MTANDNRPYTTVLARVDDLSYRNTKAQGILEKIRDYIDVVTDSEYPPTFENYNRHIAELAQEALAELKGD